MLFRNQFMLLKIYNLEGEIFSGQVTSVSSQTLTGEITILDHHRPLVTVLKAGQIKIIKPDEEKVEITVSGGFLEVRPGNQVSIIVK